MCYDKENKGRTKSGTSGRIRNKIDDGIKGGNQVLDFRVYTFLAATQRAA